MTKQHSSTETRHIERFAPSPNGHLHLGHAYSAMLAYRLAKAAGGVFLLRLEDIDQARARVEYEEGIYEDLHWLGLDWQTPVLKQSERMEAYAKALDDLRAKGLLYACSCTRRDINSVLSAPQEIDGQMPAGPDGPAYPGICRGRYGAHWPKGAALRLDMAAAIESLGGDEAVRALTFIETGQGPNAEQGEIALDPDWLRLRCGDVVLARKEFPTSYHLSVAVDDAYQQVTHVTRGCDLFSATALHRLLQALLNLPVPRWHHHRLIRDANGRRLAKRDRDAGIRELRLAGSTPADICQMVGL